MSSNTIFQFLSEYCFMLIYGIALATSLMKYHLYYNTLLKYLPIFIAYTLLTEMMGLLVLEVNEIQIIYIEGYANLNSLIFNIYELIFFGYFLFIYWNVLYKKKKSIVKYGAILYFLITLINAYLENFIIWPQLYASLTGSIILIISIILYLKQCVLQTKRKSGLLIWISVGLLIFNFFYQPIMFFGMYNYDVYQAWSLRQVHHVIIVLMYLCFITGLLGLKRRITRDEI